MEPAPVTPREWRTYAELAARWLYDHDRPEGWTWFELSCTSLNLGECGWHRLTDARREGWITWAYVDGKKIRRPGPTDATQGASRITAKGANLFRFIDGPISKIG